MKVRIGYDWVAILLAFSLNRKSFRIERAEHETVVDKMGSIFTAHPDTPSTALGSGHGTKRKCR